MLAQLLAIARNSFVESVRQPIYFVMVATAGLLQIFNSKFSNYSMGYTESTEVSGDDKLFLDIGLATVLVCATLLAAFIATAVISREIEDKTALTVISKPVGRPMFVIGKYLGVAAAMTAAVALMLAFFLFALQHGVMSKSYDKYDFPVLVLGLGSVVLALLVAAWGNFFYGWVFTSAAVYLLIPLTILGLLGTLAFGPDWTVHASLAEVMKKEFKPTIMTACLAVGLAMLVLTAVAVACSTRLSQVMTIVVCFGVFVFGLLSNHLVGRRAFRNAPIERIQVAEARQDRNADLRDPRDLWFVRLTGEPEENLRPGDPFYYAADPTGISMAVPRQPRFTGDVNDFRALGEPPSGPALIIQSVEQNGRELIIVNAGGLEVDRPPAANDYLFTAPTKISWTARVVWGVFPNVQLFWLVDAVTQGHRVPEQYLVLLSGYTLAQVTALLAVAVILFQGREVG